MDCGVGMCLIVREFRLPIITTDCSDFGDLIIAGQGRCHGDRWDAKKISSISWKTNSLGSMSATTIFYAVHCCTSDREKRSHIFILFSGGTVWETTYGNGNLKIHLCTSLLMKNSLRDILQYVLYGRFFRSLTLISRPENPTSTFVGIQVLRERPQSNKWLDILLWILNNSTN